MANDRLRRQISFSQHEKDIYDYLDECNNASALIKKLVREHMLLEKLAKQGVIDKGSIVVDLSDNEIETKNKKRKKDKSAIEDTTQTEETHESEVAIDIEEEKDEVEEIDLDEKDKQNKNLIDNLPF